MSNGRTYVSPQLELELRANRIITPSHIDPWFGTWDGDDAMTRQQIGKLGLMGINPLTANTIVVEVATTDRQVWSRFGEPQPYRQVVCPIVGRHGDRLKVIAPIGDLKHVYPDGRLRRSRR